MDRIELQKLRDLPIEGVAERLGLRVTRHRSLCPFHDDHHASLSYRVSRNTFRCFVCGASGGPIDLVMRFLGKPFLEACRWLADEHCIILTDYQPKEEKPPRPFDATRYERFFEHPRLNGEARRFLFDERRLDPRVVRWCRLTSWKDRQGVPWLQVPYYDRDNRLIGIQNRNLAYGSESTSHGSGSTEQSSGLTEQSSESTRHGLGSTEQSSGSTSQELKSTEQSSAEPRFRFPQGSKCGIYNLPVLRRLKPADELYITEGCSDCWAMLSAGHKAIAVPSATLLTRDDVEQLKALSSSLVLSFHMWPDNDTPGERLFLQLQRVLPALRRHQLPPGCKDFSEYYVKSLTP